MDHADGFMNSFTSMIYASNTEKKMKKNKTLNEKLIICQQWRQILCN